MGFAEFDHKMWELDGAFFVNSPAVFFSVQDEREQMSLRSSALSYAPYGIFHRDPVYFCAFGRSVIEVDLISSSRNTASLVSNFPEWRDDHYFHTERTCLTWVVLQTRLSRLGVAKYWQSLRGSCWLDCNCWGVVQAPGNYLCRHHSTNTSNSDTQCGVGCRSHISFLTS